MNCLKTLTIVLASALFFTSCDKPDTSGPEIPEDSSYRGTFTAFPGADNEYVLEDAGVELVIDEGESTAELKMLRVKFAERMPEMDITVPGVTLEKTSAGYAVSGDGIIPIAMGGPFAARTVTGLTGTVTAGTLSFSMNCGSDPLTFTGTREADE